MDNIETLVTKLTLSIIKLQQFGYNKDGIVNIINIVYDVCLNYFFMN
jgi:hypothetical protein